MRISTMQEQTSMLSSLQQATLQSVEDWNRVASGKKLNQPSDDPLTAVQILEVDRRIATTEIYLQNITTLSSLLDHEDILLKDCIEQVGQARDIVLSSNNAALDSQGLQAHGQNMSHIIDSIISVMNTRDADGHYLFGGSRSFDAPVVLDSDGLPSVGNDDNNQRQVLVTETAKVAGPDTAQSLCFAISDGNGGTFNLLDVMIALRDQLSVASPDFADDIPEHLEKIDRASDSLNGIQTALGARTNMLTSTADGHSHYKLFCQKLVGDLGDLDYAATVTHLNQSMITVEAARKSLSSVSGLSLFQYIKI